MAEEKGQYNMNNGETSPPLYDNEGKIEGLRKNSVAVGEGADMYGDVETAERRLHMQCIPAKQY